MKKAKKHPMHTSVVHNNKCPYCGSTVVLRSADGIYKENSSHVMLYVCSQYPKCDAYVRVHPGTTQPVGTLANGKLRALRYEAHKQFDQLYLTGVMSKNEAYTWLAGILSVPKSQAHIGYLGEYYCGLVIEESKKLMEWKRRRNDTALIKQFAGGESA